MTLEKKVYSSWAFTKDEDAKYAMNRIIYEEIKGKATLAFAGYGYNHEKYEVVDNPHNLSTDELALIADKGNLCFGYRTEGKYIVIHTD